MISRNPIPVEDSLPNLAEGSSSGIPEGPSPASAESPESKVEISEQQDSPSEAICNGTEWQQALASLIKTPEALLEAVNLPKTLLKDSLGGHKQFPVRVTHSYVSRMVKGDRADPLLLQVLPLLQEQESHSAFSDDPLNERHFTQSPGILQKYKGRALLISTSACAIHCRYCFRRHFPYENHRQSIKAWEKSLEYIKSDSTIEEVILSGGDPLSLNDHYLDKLISMIEAIPQIKTLRIHTRLPIVLPSRVNSSLLKLLTKIRLNKVVVVHANHANEIDSTVGLALSNLRETSTTVLNQTVLLKGINDDYVALKNLSNALFDYGTLPYYLHMMDKVRGAGHFHVSIDHAKSIMDKLRANLPGYLVPKLVLEEPGALSKTPVPF